MNKNKKNCITFNHSALSHWLFAITCILSSFSISDAQTEPLQIDTCYALAKNNYPLVKQMALLEKTKEYSINNASKGYLPQINLSGQASYQSDVTQIPITLPNVNIPALSKDQYKLYGEINQPLTDVFIINQQKELIKENSVIEEQKLEVELYKLKDRVDQLFFGILLIDAQIEQTELLKKDIQSGIDKTTVAIANGTALKSSLNMLKAELLKAGQHIIELKANRKGFTDMLSLFINRQVNESTKLETPPTKAISTVINRPELKLFDIQKESFDIQNKLVTAKNIPHLGLFFQSGYGRPALNFLKNDFAFYYIGGLRLNWNLSGFYTFKKDKQLITINQNLSDVQKEVFLFNTNILLAQQNTEISKLQELINSDKEIVALRESVKNTSNVQLENGTITTNDYLISVNAEDQAKQNILLHQIQLLLAQYNYQTTSGN